MTDLGDGRSARVGGVGGLAGALVGLAMLGYVFRHISERPVGWASMNSDGVEDQGLMVAFLVFGAVVAVLFGGAIGVAAGWGVGRVGTGWTIQQLRLASRLAATCLVAATPLILPRADSSWTTVDAVQCGAVCGAVCTGLWLVVFAVRTTVPSSTATS